MDYTTVSRDRWQDHWLFLTHFRKSPRTVGAIAPSSRRLARAMLDGLTGIVFVDDAQVVELTARKCYGPAEARVRAWEWKP